MGMEAAFRGAPLRLSRSEQRRETAQRLLEVGRLAHEAREGIVRCLASSPGAVFML